jgi:hypothetical protein
MQTTLTHTRARAGAYTLHSTCIKVVDHLSRSSQLRCQNLLRFNEIVLYKCVGLHRKRQHIVRANTHAHSLRETISRDQLYPVSLLQTLVRPTRIPL